MKAEIKLQKNRKDLIPMKKFLKNEGFTLVELIVVIAILGILAAVAVPAYTGYIEKANASADTQVVAAVKTAADAALVQVGTVTGLTVTDNGSTDKVVATVDSKTYTLMGDKAASGENATDTMRADFATFMGGNDISFKGKTGSNTNNTATWASTGWTFSYAG